MYGIQYAYNESTLLHTGSVHISQLTDTRRARRLISKHCLGNSLLGEGVWAIVYLNQVKFDFLCIKASTTCLM